MTISVTQLNNYIKGILDLDGVLNDLSVCGEITNVKQAREGWYFSLKDENSAIDCFSYGQQPQTGMTAVAEGRISFWQRSGRLSFYVRRLTVGNQSGAAYLQFLQIKELSFFWNLFCSIECLRRNMGLAMVTAWGIFE